MWNVVTGGAGFIGSWLCRTLLKRGENVICIDDFTTGSRDNIAFILKDLQVPEKFKFLDRDVRQNLLDITDEINCIYHLASPASPIDYYKYPIKTLTTGSLGTQNVLDLAKTKKARFVLASTSEVYGDPLEHPQRESYWGNVNPIGKRAVYDEAKRYAEAISMAYYREYNVDIKIARIFNTYGPRMRISDGRVIPSFVSSVLNHKEIIVYGDGTQTRSFCYVTDMVDGIMKLAASDLKCPVNLGNPNEISVLELARFLKQKTRSKSQIVFAPLPEDDPKCRRPDIGLAIRALGWEPKVDLKTGIKEMAEVLVKS